MSKDDDTGVLAWRNLITQWHLDQGMPDCGCDDDTPDHEFCASSVAWADAHYVEHDDSELAGPVDKWDHDIWVAAWGRNAPLIASAADYRLPMAPKGMAWLATRCLVRGQCAVDMVLYRLGKNGLAPVAQARVPAEPTIVLARARAMLQDVSR